MLVSQQVRIGVGTHRKREEQENGYGMPICSQRGELKKLVAEGSSCTTSARFVLDPGPD